MKLKLKDSIQKLIDQKRDITIRRNGNHNKMDVFKHDTPESEYLEYRKKGFRIFVCSECNREFCRHIRRGFRDEEVQEDIKSSTKTEEHVLGGIENDYSEYNMPTLRKMFPDIKAVSKIDFVNKIKEKYGTESEES